MSATAGTVAAVTQPEAACLGGRGRQGVRDDDSYYHYLMGTYYAPGTILSTLNVLFHPVFIATNEVSVLRNPTLQMRTLRLRERWLTYPRSHS